MKEWITEQPSELSLPEPAVPELPAPLADVLAAADRIDATPVPEDEAADLALLIDTARRHVAVELLRITARPTRTPGPVEQDQPDERQQTA